MDACFDILSSISAEDEDLLQRIAKDVNKKHFSGGIDLAIRWGIPSASEISEPKIDVKDLSHEEKLQLVHGVQLFFARKLDEAKRTLKPLMDKGQREAAQLYVRVLMLMRDPTWPDVAKRINSVCVDTIFVPPGSTEIIDGVKVILIHPTLSQSAGHSAPRYALRYVAFHEMLHGWMDTSDDEPHPPAFRRLDSIFPGRDRAVTWLKRNRFSILEDVPR